jgi:hypothetical protein
MGEPLRGLVPRLLEKTRRGRVNWAHTPSPTAKARYSVNLLSAYLVVQLTRPTNGVERVSFRIQPDLNDNEDALAESSAAEGEPDWPVLRELFQAAQQKARGWENIFRTIEQLLDSDAVIG